MSCDGVRKIEPLLHEIRPQHDRQTHRLPPLTRLGIVRTHQRLQCRPPNHLLHLVQKQLATALPSVLLKHCMTRQTLLPHRSHLTAMRLINHSKVAELVQSLPKAFRGEEEPFYDTNDPSLLRIRAEWRTLIQDLSTKNPSET